MIIELNFEKISKTVKNSTAKPRTELQPVSLSEASGDTASVIKERLTLYKVFNDSSFCRNPTPQV